MTNKTAIITGASTGIGFETAKEFLEAGYNVVLNARTEADLAKASHALSAFGATAWVAGDVSQKATGAAVVAKAVDTFGGVDVLVNNAGVFNARPFLDTDEAELDRIAEIVYALVRDFGGTVSAEHGIGTLKKPYLPFARSPEEIALMTRIRAALDPAGIMNPGKVF